MFQVKESIKNYPYKLILGSSSPRRQELLKSLGFEFAIKPINADESFPETLKGSEIPIYLAEKKANVFPDKLKDNELLITSDTVVWVNNQVLNKPENYEEAVKMLQLLSGKAHEVFTAVRLTSNIKHISFFDTTKVYFKELKKEEIEYYVNNFNVYDKAGGYGVQDWIGYVGIDKIEGSFYNVMGLPVQELYEELVKF